MDTAPLARTGKGAQAARLLSEIACVRRSSNKCGKAAFLFAFPTRGRLCVKDSAILIPFPYRNSIPHTHNKAALRRYFDSAAERLIYFNRGDSMISG